eukprot:scaffold14555_cov29-Tisochrysis_lutea.AAC.3
MRHLTSSGQLLRELPSPRSWWYASSRRQRASRLSRLAARSPTRTMGRRGGGRRRHGQTATRASRTMAEVGRQAHAPQGRASRAIGGYRTEGSSRRHCLGRRAASIEASAQAAAGRSAAGASQCAASLASCCHV